jgi:hypothetical protein
MSMLVMIAIKMVLVMINTLISIMEHPNSPHTIFLFRYNLMMFSSSSSNICKLLFAALVTTKLSSAMLYSGKLSSPILDTAKNFMKA